MYIRKSRRLRSAGFLCFILCFRKIGLPTVFIDIKHIIIGKNLKTSDSSRF